MISRLCLSLFLSFLAVPHLTAQTTPPAATTQPASQTKGSVIGTTIKDIITTALPGVTSLVDGVMGAISSHLRPHEQQPAAQAVQATVKQSLNNAADATRQKLVALDTAARQLDVVTQFADAGSNANERVIKILSFVAANPAATPAQWTSQVVSPWNQIDAILKPLDGFTDTTLNNSVRDSYVNPLLRQILLAKKTLIVDTTTLIQQNSARMTATKTPTKVTIQNLPEIQTSLSDLQKLLSSVGAVAVFQVQELAGDLHTLSGAQGNHGQAIATRFDKIRSGISSLQKKEK